MTAPVEQVRFALRRRTAAAWAALNETLKKGEPGIEIDTGFGKTGDGGTAWNDLLYTFDGYTDLTGLAEGKAKVWDATNARWKIGDAGKTYTPGTGIAIDDPTSATPSIRSTLGSIALTGRKEDYAHLPSSGNSPGDAYLLDSDGLVYVYDGGWPASGKGIRIDSRWRLIGSYDYSVSGAVAARDFVDLGQYSELLILGRAVTSSGSGDIRALASVDNGASFYNTPGNYEFTAPNGASSLSSVFASSSGNSGAAKSFAWEMTLDTTPPQSFSRAYDGNQRFLVATPNRVNAIRLAAASGNMTGGKVYVHAK